MLKWEHCRNRVLVRLIGNRNIVAEESSMALGTDVWWRKLEESLIDSISL